MPWLANPDWFIVAFLILFKAHTSILFIIKGKIFVLVKWSCRSPSTPIIWLLNLQWLSYFEHILHYVFNTHLLGIHSWSHTKPPTLIHKCSNEKEKERGEKKKKKTNHKGLPYACYNMVDCSFTPCVAHKSINWSTCEPTRPLRKQWGLHFDTRDFAMQDMVLPSLACFVG